jgi:2-alkenal reductase
MKNIRMHLAISAVVMAGIACAITLPDIEQSTESPSEPAPSVTPFVPTSQPTLPSVVGPSPLSGLELSDLYQRVNPGVVTIWTYADLGGPHDEITPTGQGSGFLIDHNGHLVTNQHVIADADTIEVAFPSGHHFWAELVGTDPDSDLAVLHISAPEELLFPLPLGDSDLIRVGDFVVAIGNPFGLSGTMTSGIVSAIGRTLESEREAPTGGVFSAGAIIQTDAAINPGNSGGPLLNLNGEVIGVNRAIRTESFTSTGDPTNSGVGFAVPVNIVRRVVPFLIAEGTYSYPFLGISSISGDSLNLPILEFLGLPDNARGVYVTCVTPGGPAEAAGLIGSGNCGSNGINPGGDLITKIDDIKLSDFSDLITYLIMKTEPGMEISLTVYRAEQEVEVLLIVGARP